MDLTTDGEWLYVQHETDDIATGVFSLLGYGFTADACHTAASGPGRVPVEQDFPRAGDLYAIGVIDSGTYVTPWGSARVWNTRYGDWVDDVLAPARVPSVDSMWWLPTEGLKHVGLQIDGVTIDYPSHGDWRFTVTPSGLLHELQLSNAISYTAGEATDTIRFATTEGAYSRSIPHVTPNNELDFALVGDNRFVLTVGPVVLENENDPTITRTLSFSIAWTHPRLARPE